MKKKSILRISMMAFALSGLLSVSAYAQKDDRIVADAKEAKENFIKVDGLLNNVFEKAYGYAIFPNVGKGGIGIGGAAGNGVVYEQGNLVGMAKMTQITVGFQWGGQAYREVIFFESKADLERFKGNNLEFSAQASAVAVTAGASGNVKYANGVMIFTQTKGGLMYEASVGGQKFKFTKI